MYVSPSMSLVVAGVASGICFLIYTNIIKGKSGESRQGDKEIPVDDNHCSCCLRPFFLNQGVRCKDCGAKSCRKGCSRLDPSDNAWHCLFCRQQRYWLAKTESEVLGGPIDKKELNGYVINTAKSRVYVPGVENATTSSSGQGLAAEKEEANPMETVRDFVERIVDGLIGNLNDASINRLYDHPAYDMLMEKDVAPLVDTLTRLAEVLHSSSKNDTITKKHVPLLMDALTRLATILLSSLKNKPSGDSATMAHTTLREVVERVVEEARKLPSLAGTGGKAHEPKNIAENNYEDILATAILNKVAKMIPPGPDLSEESPYSCGEAWSPEFLVIEKFQKEQVDGNSNVLPGKPASATKYPLSESEAGLDEGVEEGCSSLEPLSQDECSSECSTRAPYSKRIRSQPEPLSLTIEERIEEVTTYTSEDDPKTNDVLAIRNAYRVPFPELGMDIIDPLQDSEDSQDEPDTPTTHIGLVSPIESWEENWLFQRKRVPTQADPVNMLVPNPSADYKALIGDKDAEDTSDLSECSAQSDEEIEKELIEAISNVVPRSPKEPVLQNGYHSTDVPSKENGIGAFSEWKTEKQCASTVKDQNETKRNEENGETRVESVKENETIGTKEVEEKKSERVETEVGEPVPKPIDVIGNDPSNGEMERRTKNENDKSKEDETRNSIEVGYSDELVPRPTEKNEVVNKSMASLVSSEPSVEENGLDVPKTPTSTPTAKISPNDTNEENVASNEGDVLSSLECAKKKLMAVNDYTGEAFENEESRSTQQKLDFHAEDIQQESEYTEHYDTATQRHLDSLTKTETSESSPMVNSTEGNEESKCREAVALAKAESASHLFLQDKSTEEEVRLATPPKPGTIAEREHRKWENAPPIENNPYSQENIQKRLWERQYSRRPSDIPGVHQELQKSNGDDLDVMLATPEPDIKRFGRDYYINDSRTAVNEKGRRSAASTSSRPSSSLSQRSSSTGIAEDQQEETRYREKESLLNQSNDVKSRVAKWQNNNVEGKYQTPVRQDDDGANETGKEKFPKKIECQRTWEDQRMEEILENERKNSKNEVNAKLNNQENYENAVIETRKSDENPRKIKRIDLKAYGFENAFTNETIKTSAPRVVNKLDLKSFGYDGGIRRTQSNVQLNSIGTEEFKPRLIRSTHKSNLTRRNDYENDRRDAMEGSRGSGDNNLTQSNEALNKFDDERGYNDFGLKSAKSVPNIAKFYSNMSSHEDEEVEGYNEGQMFDEFRVIKNGSVKNIASTYNLEKCNIRSSDSSVDESEIDTDNSSEREQHLANGKKKTLSDEELENKVLPMPSVRRLAEAFSKQTEPVSTSFPKVTKSGNVYKERSSTPEIQIVETPRQMHSLTARSLSKQFREGLRQIPNKVTTPPASHVVMEQPNIPESQNETVPSAKSELVSNDTNVILPGKLKSNIIFWEQMQRKT